MGITFHRMKGIESVQLHLKCEKSTLIKDRESRNQAIMHIFTGMYQSGDILGTRVPRTFERGHIFSGRPVTPPIGIQFRNPLII